MLCSLSLQFQFQPIWIPIRDWNNAYLKALRCNAEFQPIWIPIRDWNGFFDAGGLGWCVSTNLNPYQGLKRFNPVFLALFYFVSTNLNPYQGLKRASAQAEEYLAVFQPIWIPIRDWNKLSAHASARLGGSGFNQSESLSGIETLTGANLWMRCLVSTNLNPYQGLKPHYCFASRCTLMFQPIWIPIRDWNRQTCLFWV